MRIVLYVGVVLVVAVGVAMVFSASLGSDPGPLSVTIPTRPGTMHLEMVDSRPKTRWQYRLLVKSRAKEPVRLKARFSGEAPEGMRVVVAGDALVGRESTAEPTLILVAPEKPGPFAGAVVVYSDDLPGWGLNYTFAGNVTDRGLEGKFVRPEPRATFDAGELRPGERKRFRFAIKNIGSEEVEVTDVGVADWQHLRLPRDLVPHTIAPGDEFEIAGLLIPPKRAGPLRYKIEIFSDAQNYPRAVDLWVTGKVVPDYAPEPPRLESRTEYPILGKTFRVKIRAREGVEPFTIGAVERHERFFEIVSQGTGQPAAEQEIRLKMRRDAPTNVAEDVEFTILFRIVPAGKEVLLPVKMRLLAPINAFPYELYWRGGDLMPKEVRLAAFASRRFEVTRAYPASGRFEVILRPQKQGMTPVIIVSIPKGTRPGILQDRIVIETDDPDVPRILVPARARVK